METSQFGVINVSVSTHYREPTSRSDVTTQGLLGEKVEILERSETHLYIRQLDGYQSWIPADQIVPWCDREGRAVIIRDHFTRLYAQPDTASAAVRDAVIGSRLTAVDEARGWLRILLPDGSSGWVKQTVCGKLGEFSAANIVSLAKEFLGYQYLWGGLSPKGFDCSGLVQTVFRLHGVQLPRDAWQQQQHHQLSDDYHAARPGDLLFFSHQSDRVTHVAISLGEQRYLHASGWVRLDSFNPDDAVFTRQRLSEFVSVNRYPPTGLL